MSDPKLYTLTRPTYQLPSHSDFTRHVVTKPAENIPIITWPDGKWCFPANFYMLRLYRRGLSRRDRGGTLLTYATNITHLLRFCHKNKIRIDELTDSQFTFFITTLHGEKKAKVPTTSARNANSVIAIGRICLDFLSVIGETFAKEDFVGPTGTIRAERKEILINPRRSGGPSSVKIVSKHWHHHSFPTPAAIVRRLPISSDVVEKLRNAVLPASTSIYQRKRRYVMLKLLEITGGGRSEVAALTVNSVLEASRMPDPRLKLITVKKRGGAYAERFIPISTHDVGFLIEFIEKNRRQVIRSTCGFAKDDGYLLVSSTTGFRLRANTITQEVAALALNAGIMEKSCPHMFRHRFITKLFVALIERHSFENVDSFRRALLQTESIKQEVQQWTGHSDTTSLDIYIHLAFQEQVNFQSTCDFVHARRSVDSARATTQQLRDELHNGTSSEEVTNRLLLLLDGLTSDLATDA